MLLLGTIAVAVAAYVYDATSGRLKRWRERTFVGTEPFPALPGVDSLLHKVAISSALLSALAVFGVGYFVEGFPSRYGNRYLWTQPASDSSDPVGLFLRLDGANHRVRVSTSGWLLYGDGKPVPEGLRYIGGHAPHLVDSSGEPPPEPQF